MTDLELSIEEGWYLQKVIHKINTDYDFLIECIFLLQDEQTADEEDDAVTVYRNNRGWNRDDAGYFGNICNTLQYPCKKPIIKLRVGTTLTCREQIRKYGNQLVRLLNEKK